MISELELKKLVDEADTVLRQAQEFGSLFITQIMAWRDDPASLSQQQKENLLEKISEFIKRRGEFLNPNFYNISARDFIDEKNLLRTAVSGVILFLTDIENENLPEKTPAGESRVPTMLKYPEQIGLFCEYWYNYLPAMQNLVERIKNNEPVKELNERLTKENAKYADKLSRHEGVGWSKAEAAKLEQKPNPEDGKPKNYRKIKF